MHLKASGIILQITPPGTPQRNVVSERRNWTLLDMVRSMMSLTDLPLSFWGYALETVVMTHKYRRCIIVLSINKSDEPNEEQKVLTSNFDQGITVNTSKQVFTGIW
jgi:hypothetical protein